MLRRLLPILLLLLAVREVHAVQYAFAVRFTDKSGTRSFSEPLSFLSSRAMARRAMLQLALDSSDLPVSRAYIDSVLTVPGSKLHLTSRWLNLCVVLLDDTSGLVTLRARPFVRSVVMVGQYPFGLHKARKKEEESSLPLLSQKMTGDATFYGNTWAQTSLLNAPSIHDRGYLGFRTLIAVFDGGFSGLNTHVAFDSLRMSGRIAETHNFVLDTNYVFDFDTHGTRATSTMAAYVPGTYVGSAPMASYALYVTEDGGSEQPIELFNMLAATERADSLGADVISCSLGYNEFDNPADNFTFTSDFDGKSTIGAIAANMATAKGILFVTSAGNEGNSPWQRILTPGDADSALTVGSVTGTGINASSSGYGPNAAGRVKPDVCALGQYAAVVNGSSYSLEDGTSFSTPQIAGWAACLREANPTARPAQIRKAITTCAHQFANPDNHMGYGIPDLLCAADKLDFGDTTHPSTRDSISILANPTGSQLQLKITLQRAQSIQFLITTPSGKTTVAISDLFQSGDNPVYNVDISSLPNAVYLFRAKSDGLYFTTRFVKW